MKTAGEFKCKTFISFFTFSDFYVTAEYDLHRAAENDDLEAAKKFIKEGANIEEKDYYGKTPLHWAGMVINTLFSQQVSKSHNSLLDPDKVIFNATPYIETESTRVLFISK